MKRIAILLILAIFAGMIPETRAQETEPLHMEETTAVSQPEASDFLEDLSVPEETVEVPELPEEQQPDQSAENGTEEVVTIPEPAEPCYKGFPSVSFWKPAGLGLPVRSPARMTGLLKQNTKPAEDNLVLTKTAADNGDGTFTLTLESYALGTASVVTKIPTPTDVVLVLDESGSMDDCIECGHELSENCKELSADCLHKVFQSELDLKKKYKTYYKDGTERIIGYCSACRKWYTGGPFSKCSGHGSLGNWIPFASECESHKYADKKYTTQFYAACGHDTQRMEALKGAATNFLNRMYSSAVGNDGIPGTGDDVDHRVAIVGFDNDEPARIYTPKESSSAGYIPASSSDAAAGSLKNILGNRTGVMDGLSRVKVRSATATNRGMEAALLIMEGNPVPAGQERNRVVILFTDGSPGSSYKNNAGWANGAIGYAHTLKQRYGTTVYTVGLFWGADASEPGNLPIYDANANGVNNLKFFQNGNRFLHLVSSNYPNAESLTATGAVAALKAGEGYYLSADNESGLYSIFSRLSNVVTPGSTSVALGKTTLVKDCITPWFEIAPGSEVTAWTESFCGTDVWEKDTESVSTEETGPLSVAVSGNTVTVSGFDYAENYVAEDQNAEGNTESRGKKLVVQIRITPIAGFLGGDGIPTNTESSAVYASENAASPVKRFPIPKVAVAVRRIIPQLQNKDIYLSQQTSVAWITNPGIYMLEGNEYSADAVRNAYADICYHITDPGGNTMSCRIPAGETWETARWTVPDGMSLTSLLKEDTQYSVSVEIRSVNNGDNSAAYETDVSVGVYLPVILFADSGVNYGDTPDLSDNFRTVTWYRGDRKAEEAVLGPAPALLFQYTPEAGALYRDTPVRVAVTAPMDLSRNIPCDQIITEYVQFMRDGCSFGGCEHTGRTAVTATDPDRINFVVHICTFDLYIRKEGADTRLDPDSSYLFQITREDGFSMKVVIHGNDTAVISGLPAAVYRISEDTDWSWRYEPESETVLADGRNTENGVLTVFFVNSREHSQWLDGEIYAVNRFDGKTTA